MMWPFSKREAGAGASRRGLQVGVMYPSGDMTILFDREGVPRVYQRELVMAIAEQVNRHPDLYRPAAATAEPLPDPDEATSPGVQPGVERSSRNGLVSPST